MLLFTNLTPRLTMTDDYDVDYNDDSDGAEAELMAYRSINLTHLKEPRNRRNIE